MRKFPCAWLLIGVLLAVAGGCDDAADDAGPVAAKSPGGPPMERSIRGDRPIDPNAKAYIPPFKHPVMPIQPVPSTGGPPDAIMPAATSNDSFGGSDNGLGLGDDKSRAREGIAGEISEALRLKKTLVVWLLDRGSKYNWDLIEPTSDRAVAKSKSKSQLLTAVIAFGKESTKITEEPIDDVSQIANSLSGIAEDPSDPLTFTAVSKAAEDYLPYRNKGYEVIFVVIGDRAGNDWAQFDEVAPKLHRAAVSVFGVGKAVPFGRRGGPAPPGGMPCESVSMERIDLQYPPPNSSLQGESDLTDSGFGPFGLERLCRNSRGKFYRLRDNNQSPGWQTGPNGDIDPAVLQALAPDYVSQADYQKLLSENKARLAVVNGAKLPYTKVFRSDQASINMYFRTRNVDAARIANQIANSQRPAAEKSFDVDRMYDVLAPGESDRKKLTGVRWQCNFDLAMGRILAAKARIDGFNALLATIKQGKSFTKPEANSFVLHRADTIVANSLLDKMAKNSRMYLDRVMKEHPGTPWAECAQRELTESVGWDMKEE